MNGRNIRAAWLALREWTSAPTLERRPEPSADMSDEASVRAFHREGSDYGALLGVYHFNARMIHHLVPQGGTIVDLGCGSGQCIKYVAERRPDLRIIGIDLSENMVVVGNEMLREQGLSDRVELRVGDMTRFAAIVPDPVHLVTSIFSLHHLPTREDLQACLGEVARLRREQGAGFWIFDHARPRRPETAREFPQVFTPLASPAFNADSTNSLTASWSFTELRAAIENVIAGECESRLARLLPLYQVHWGRRHLSSVSAPAWQEWESLPRSARKDADSLAALFRRLPG